MASIGTTPTVLGGILVPDPRFTFDAFDATASTVTEAGPLPGVPEAQGDTEMVLEATGEQEAGGKLRVRAIRAGHPGTDGARFVWRYDGDPDWRGWDPPVSLTGFEFVERTTTAGKWANHHALALADGTIAIATLKSSRYIVVWTRALVSGAWTENEVLDTGATYTNGATPALVELPSGRLLCFFWTENGSAFNLRCYYSDDTGSTWTIAQRGCLADDLDTADYTPKRLRAAYLDGQICLVWWMVDLAGPHDELYQYASADLGATFSLVDSFGGSVDRAYPDIVAHGGRLVVGYVSSDPTSGSAYPPAFRILGSAFAPIATATTGNMQSDGDPMEWGTQSGGVFDDGDLTLWGDEDGALWVLGRDYASGEAELAARASWDGGESWEEVGGGPAAHQGASTWRGRDANTYPRHLAACAHRGRAFVAHSFAANPGNADASICGLWLGGYTSACLAQESGKGNTGPRTVTSYTHTWLPYDTPEDTGGGVPVWTASSTGTAVLGSSGLALATTAGQTELRISNNIPGTLAEGVTVQAECRTVDEQCRIEVRWNDSGANEYEVAAIVTETRIRLWDLVAGAEIDGVDTTDGADGFVQLLLDVYNDNAILRYRVVGASGDREWTIVATTGSCANRGAATAPGHRVRFGHLDAGISYWRMVCYMSDGYTGEHIYGQSNPAEMLGRALCASPVFVDAGTSIQAVDGPAFRNDEWNIDSRAEYPVSNVFASVAGSPRRVWRSVSDDVDAKLYVDLTDGRAAETIPMGALVACYIGGANFGICYLEGSNSSGAAWTRLAAIDLRKTGLKWTRADRAIKPDTTGGSSVGHYLHAGSLAGCHFVMDDGEDPIVRRIDANAPGAWKAGANTLETRILLDEVDGTEPTSGTAGELWFKDGLAIVATTGGFRKLRLIIPAQTTAEGYFELGVWHVGHLFPTSGYLMGTGWGRSLEWATEVEQVEGRSGIRTVRALAPTRRAVEVAWVDGVETSGLTGADPDYLVGWAGGKPVCVPADAPFTVPGLVGALGGAETPIVYVAAFAVPTGTGSSHAVVVTDPALLLYGRIASGTLRSDVVLGQEGASELIRLGTVRIEEET